MRRSARTAISLDAVRVTAGRERPGRNDNGQDIGGREQTLNTNNVPIDILGDLAAMAATLPGVTLIPDANGGASGFSVLGLGADQNNITLNGLNFGGTDLPRDATTQTRVTTSSFDPSRGGFSGAQIALRTNSGTELPDAVAAPDGRRAESAVHRPDRPPARPAVHEPAAERQRGRSVLVRQGVLLVLVAGRPPLQYAAGSLNTDPLALERVGVSADSVQRLLSTLASLNIPTSTSAIPDRPSHAERLVPLELRLRAVGHAQLHVTMNGRWQGQDATNLNTLAVPVHGGDTRSYGGTLQGATLQLLLGQLPRRDERVDSRQRDDGRSVSLVPVHDGSRELGLHGRTPAGVSNLQFGGSTSLPAQLEHADERAPEYAVVDQPRQQAPLQVRAGSAVSPLLAGQHDEPLRHVHVQLAVRFRERNSLRASRAVCK